MTVYTNTSGGLIVLPDGTEIKAGEAAEVTEAMLEIVSVRQFVESGWLVEDEKPKRGRPAKAEK